MTSLVADLLSLNDNKVNLWKVSTIMVMGTELMHMMSHSLALENLIHIYLFLVSHEKIPVMYAVKMSQVNSGTSLGVKEI